MRIIIANIGTENKGKSTSIKEVFYLLSKRYPHNVTKLIDNGDIEATIEVKGKLVGIESQGDPNSRIFETLPELVNMGCEIIVCACRTSGGTKDLVEETCRDNNYTLIYSANARTSADNLLELLNRSYAHAIVKLIESQINH